MGKILAFYMLMEWKGNMGGRGEAKYHLLLIKLNQKKMSRKQKSKKAGKK
jgi:hypothetical protein